MRMYLSAEAEQNCACDERTQKMASRTGSTGAPASGVAARYRQVWHRRLVCAVQWHSVGDGLLLVQQPAEVYDGIGSAGSHGSAGLLGWSWLHTSAAAV